MSTVHGTKGQGSAASKRTTRPPQAGNTTASRIAPGDTPSGTRNKPSAASRPGAGNIRPAAVPAAAPPVSLALLPGLKAALVWIGGSLAGMTTILYVCGYLITTAHIYTLGLYGLVDFSKDHFLLEGAKFVIAAVIGVAHLLINPVTMLALAIVAPLVLIVIFSRHQLQPAWSQLAHWYLLHANTALATAARFFLYFVVVVIAAAISFETLRAIALHLQTNGLLYSELDPVTCPPGLLHLGDAFLCGRFSSLRSLRTVLELGVLTCVAWQLVSKWRWRKWLISPLVFATLLIGLMLPIEFGALLKPTRYPVVRIQYRNAPPSAPLKDQFLIDRSERGLTVWDPSTRRVLWIPSGDIANMETVAVRELFGSTQPE